VVRFVSPQGNDAWSGLAAQAKAEGEGPFATLARARDEIRSLRAAGKLRGGATVFIRGGTYELPETLVFTPDCSGEPGAPVTFAAYSNEAVVVSAGRRIGSWTVAGGRWQANCQTPQPAHGISRASM
jgi:hypothetical protein